MKNTNAINNFFKSLRRSVRKYSPEILTGFGIAGMISSTIMAIKATPKAMQLIEEKKKETNSERLKPVEIVGATWKCYIPSMVTILGSSACIIGASTVHTKRNAALATAYSFSESALKLYQEKVIETIGEKEEQKVRDAVAKERVERNPIVSKEVIITEKGNTLCLDSISGRYFKSDIETIRKVINDINYNMYSDMYVSLNDYYYEIGLPGIKTGDSLGWNIDKGMIEPSFSSQLATDGTPCLVVDFSVPPTYGYDKL